MNTVKFYGLTKEEAEACRDLILNMREEARKKKAEYDTEFNKKPSQRKKRAELSKVNREHDKKYGK